MFDQQAEHSREGRLMISAVKAAMAKIAQEVTVRAVHLHGSIGVSNVMRFGQYMALALHEGLADGVTELHLTAVSRAVLRKYTPAKGNFPTEVLFERKAWAAEQLQPVMDEIGVSFAEGRGTVDVIPHPQP
jgi:acyl-CoA dehydrogenase